MSFYESPVFVELLLDSIYILLAMAVMLTGWSAVRSVRLRKGQHEGGGVPVRGIAWGVFALLVLTLGATALLADVSPMTINGHMYDNTAWLRVSDMLINTSAVLMLVAVVCLIVGYTGVVRKYMK